MRTGSVTPFFAKKALGQHFLIDPNIRAKIVEAAEIRSTDRVVEIGPGQGFLTEVLIQAAREVIAIEVDRRCLELLEKRFSSKNSLRLIRGDALNYPFDQIPEGFKVVSNLPYYLSTPLLFRLLQAGTRIQRMVLMVQREVARRLVSRPGSKDYGGLSIAVQFHAEVRLEFPVSANCFRPRPKVSSSVLTIVPRSSPRVPVLDEDRFHWVVRHAFLHRRKLLKNSLTHAGLSPVVVSEALSACGIDPKGRPESLTLAEFAALSDRLFEKTRQL